MNLGERIKALPLFMKIYLPLSTIAASYYFISSMIRFGIGAEGIMLALVLLFNTLMFFGFKSIVNLYSIGAVLGLIGFVFQLGQMITSGAQLETSTLITYGIIIVIQGVLVYFFQKMYKHEYYNQPKTS